MCLHALSAGRDGGQRGLAKWSCQPCCCGSSNSHAELLLQKEIERHARRQHDDIAPVHRGVGRRRGQRARAAGRLQRGGSEGRAPRHRSTSHGRLRGQLLARYRKVVSSMTDGIGALLESHMDVSGPGIAFGGVPAAFGGRKEATTSAKYRVLHRSTPCRIRWHDLDR